MALQQRKKKPAHLSSSPPNLRTMFRREKTVPKTSLASSSALRAGWYVAVPFTYACEDGLAGALVVAEFEGLAHRLL